MGNALIVEKSDTPHTYISIKGIAYGKRQSLKTMFQSTPT